MVQRLFSRFDLTTAVRFIAHEAERVEVYVDDSRRIVRVFVATLELGPIEEPTLTNVALIVRDFVPGKLAIEVVSVGEAIHMAATKPTIPPMPGG